MRLAQEAVDKCKTCRFFTRTLNLVGQNTTQVRSFDSFFHIGGLKSGFPLKEEDPYYRTSLLKVNEQI